MQQSKREQEAAAGKYNQPESKDTICGAKGVDVSAADGPSD